MIIAIGQVVPEGRDWPVDDLHSWTQDGRLVPRGNMPPGAPGLIGGVRGGEQPACAVHTWYPMQKNFAPAFSEHIFSYFCELVIIAVRPKNSVGENFPCGSSWQFLLRWRSQENTNGLGNLFFVT
jgi:hypothetical protein